MPKKLTKPKGCNCQYPKFDFHPSFMSESGHSASCPYHAEWMKQWNEMLDKLYEPDDDEVEMSQEFRE